MNAPRTLRTSPARCVHCGQPLSALRTLRTQVCERPACLQHVAQEQLRAERLRHDAAIRRSLGTRLPPGRAESMPILWMRVHDVTLVPLPQAKREDQTRHLRALAETAADGAAAEPERVGTTPARAEIQMCTWCQGRCCRDGGDHHAFIGAAHLRRWQNDHPGSSLADAAQAYIDALPEVHAEMSCCYHGPQGCTLPRSMRASICNRHVCEALGKLQVLCDEDAARDVVLVMGRREAEAVRLAAADGLLTIEPLPD